MNLQSDIPVYGDITFRDKKCPVEAIEQITCFNWMRHNYPEIEAIAIHPKNEQKRKGGQFQQLKTDKAMGFKSGASDIIIPSAVSFVCELKRADHTLCKWQAGQQEYLMAASKAGSFVCVALGHKGFIEAFGIWHDAFIAQQSL